MRLQFWKNKESCYFYFFKLPLLSERYGLKLSLEQYPFSRRKDPAGTKPELNHCPSETVELMKLSDRERERETLNHFAELCQNKKQ